MFPRINRSDQRQKMIVPNNAVRVLVSQNLSRLVANEIPATCENDKSARMMETRLPGQIYGELNHFDGWKRNIKYIGSVTGTKTTV
jgi:hypothetical protein